MEIKWFKTIYVMLEVQFQMSEKSCLSDDMQNHEEESGMACV